MVLEIGNNKALTVIRPLAVMDVLSVTKNHADLPSEPQRQGKLIFQQKKEPESLLNLEKGSFVDYYT
jgi:hypothetical protein